MATPSRDPRYDNQNQPHPATKPQTKYSNVGIFVTGYCMPVNYAALKAIFQSFGPIKQYEPKGKQLFINYCDEKSANRALANSVNYEGVTLTVLRKKLTSVEQALQKSTNFMDVIQSVQDFNEQVKIFLTTLQPTDNTAAQKYHRICTDLWKSLSQKFPACIIHTFGSTVTGLNFIDSDLDVFIENMTEPGGTDTSVLRRAKNCLYKSFNFTRVLVIPNAKVPLVKCLHKPTGISIDINCKTMAGVINSRLVRYYVHLEENLKPLFMVLKYWGKVNKLTGSNHLITNYSLCMLIIFYLQQPPFNVLAVRDLMLTEVIQDGWNHGFVPVEYKNDLLRNTSLLELLTGFFHFYKKFDYGSNVICPYLGRIVPRNIFIDATTITDDFMVYKENIIKAPDFYPPLRMDTAICLQDPFMLNRNTLAVITPVTLDLFVSFCNLSETLCRESQNNLLYKLYTTIPVTQSTVTTEDTAEFSITKAASLRYLTKRITGDGPVEKLMEEAWFDTVIKFLHIFFVDILYCSIEEISESQTAGKAKRMEGQQDVHDQKLRHKLMFNARTPYILWHTRNQASKTILLDPNMPIVEKEKAISNYIVSEAEELGKNTYKLTFKITLICRTDPTTVTIQLHKVQAYKKSFKSMTQFVVPKFPNLFAQYENDLNNDKIK